MSEELDLLREIGAQKIYEDTHIPLKHVQSVIHESFEGLTKVQFLGFISILQREYNQDLSVLKSKGLAYFNDETFKDVGSKSLFIETKRAKKPTLLYVLIVLIVFSIVAYISIDSNSSTTPSPKIDNSAIESVQKNLDPIVVDLNSSDSNLSEVDENTTNIIEELEVIEAVEVTPSFKILPKSKLWIGYIDKEKKIKKQTIIKESLELDPSKEWLLSLGHGHVDIEINGEIQEFRSGNNIRFLYKKGELQKLTLRDFKILNEGRVW